MRACHRCVPDRKLVAAALTGIWLDVRFVVLDLGSGGIEGPTRTTSVVLAYGLANLEQPLPRQATYSATKAFVNTFSDALNAETHGTGVTVTSLRPGPVKTRDVLYEPIASHNRPENYSAAAPIGLAAAVE